MSSDLMGLGLRTWRSVAGEDSRLERQLRARYRARRGRRVTRSAGPGWVQETGERFVHVRSTTTAGPDRGIYLKGGCDLPALFLLVDHLRGHTSGSVTVFSQGIGISDARADILLQTLGTVPEAASGEICRRLGLPASYFAPVLFEPTFHVAALPAQGPIDKTVVALTIGPNLVRSAYRHRESGLIVDPGGWWLNQSMDKVLGDLSAAQWFRDNFEGLGRLSVDAFQDVFAQVVQEVRRRTRAHVLVFNTLVVDPGSRTHSYRFVTAPATARRRRYALALSDLAADCGAHVVDVDRVLKASGVDSQVDFAHYSVPEQGLIAAEALRILRDLDVVEG